MDGDERSVGAVWSKVHKIFSPIASFFSPSTIPHPRVIIFVGIRQTRQALRLTELSGLLGGVGWGEGVGGSCGK